MKIRSKLLVMLLLIAVLPLIVATAWQQMSMRGLGKRLAARTRQALIDGAHEHLERVVESYGELVRRNKKAVELAVGFQAREVEHRLRTTLPPRPRVYFSKDYDEGRDLPAGMRPSSKHFRPDGKGGRTPVPVTYEEQVYFVVKGVSEESVADDIARLSTMPEVYKHVYDANPEPLYWQYTSLESGFHTSYPGHGGYPSTYDPRKRHWYQKAKEAGGLVWVVMPEVSTRTVALAVAMPVYRPDGTFAGVTAIDVPFDQTFHVLGLRGRLAEDAEVMAAQGGDRLSILVQKSYLSQGEDWERPTKLQLLESADAEELKRMRQDVLDGKPGLRRMPYKGRDSAWAYGTCSTGQPFPLIIVPYAHIVRRADEAEEEVLAATRVGLQIAGAGVLAVGAVVALLALRGSRAVTLPIRQLANAADRFAAGDYGVTVDIATGDELQELGETVNDLGPKLLERERMKQSLTLAMEIQRHLLPNAPPEVENFDIAGNSIYCDETGGDYYDFIDLVDLGEGKLAVAVGDVTGHGIGAALLMASARAALRSQATLHGDDLSDLFRTLNIHLVRDTGDERFMTLFYCVLDAASRSLRWISAGHNPALLWRASSRTVDEFGSTGMVLGVLEDEEFGQAGPVELKPGDVFLIGTDGIWEAHNTAGEMFGNDRLLDVLEANAEGTSQIIYDAVVDAVADFHRGIPQEDDITLVVIKVR